MRRLAKWIWGLLFLSVCAQFSLCYVSLTGFWMDLHAYANGRARVPFQGRMLMMIPLRWAEHDPAIVRFASHHVSSMRSPDLIVIAVASFVSLALTGWLVTRFYSELPERTLFAWLPCFLLLVLCFSDFVLHYENNFIYPYDLPSMLFFTMGIYFIYRGWFWALLALFPVATLNRESTLFLIPLLAVDAAWQDERLELRRLLQPGLIAKVLSLGVVWIAIKHYVVARYAGNPGYYGSHLSENLRSLHHPEVWPQILSTGAYLPLLIPFLWTRIRPVRLRMYLLVLPPWILAMVYYGNLMETRLAGELHGLLAITIAIGFEALVRERILAGEARRGELLPMRTAHLAPQPVRARRSQAQ